MRKLILTSVFISAAIISCFSQGGQNYTTSGNSLSSTDILGSTNNAALRMLTNQQLSGFVLPKRVMWE